MDSSNELLGAYSGQNAVDYDAKRSKSSRWTNEIRVMKAYLSALRPKLVVDCPFGTGRWIAEYEAVGTTVVGIDLSRSMLAAAETKIAELPEESAAKFRLVEKSIFDLASSDFSEQPDLAICVRFVNWVDLEGVDKSFAALSRLKTKHLIVGCSVIPESSSRLYRTRLRWALWRRNRANKGRPTQYVHDESVIKQLFAKYQWTVEAQEFVFKNASRENYIFRLRNQTVQ